MNTNDVLKKKANDALVVYDDLVKRLGINDLYETNFIADPKLEKLFKASYIKENPFPNVLKFVLGGMRKEAVERLFEEEKVLQTPVIAAVLALCSNVATSIGKLRGDDTSNTKIDCDILYSGMQAVRLYLADYKNKEFKKARLKSAMRVKNAYNGSFIKYKSKDNRYVSFHVYYQSQQERLNKVLNSKKESAKFSFLTTRKDKKYLASIFERYNALELEKMAFVDAKACGCMLRSREEWDNTEVGKAVNAMPLIRFQKFGNGDIPNYGKPDKRGPLSGIKILDLTHIIAGPACSRVLAEYGADVLLVRRGKLIDQEQAMLELDGWAGKRAINLDLNKEPDLAKMKKLIKEADVITYSYQDGAFDKFGLSIEEIRKLNPNIIYSHLMCFSDTVWRDRPGWAPCAEDITGLSVRNGSMEHPVNLNGVPLDYIPGFILALGTLLAIKEKLENGANLEVTTSLTRGAVYLHEATDICMNNPKVELENVKVRTDAGNNFDRLRVYVDTKSIGLVGFPMPATYNSKYPNLAQNMKFSDDNKGFLNKN